MYQDNRQLAIRGVIAGIFTLTAIVGFALYRQSNTYAPVHSNTTTATPVITDPEILQNWLPDTVYQYTVARISDYLVANNLYASSLSARDRIVNGSGAYDFAVTLLPQNQTLDVSVSVNNLQGIMSTAVTIDGTLQQQLIQTVTNDGTSTGSSTTYTGLDGLIEHGITTTEISELQSLLQKYAPASTSIDISPNTIQASYDQDTGTMSYTFVVTINTSQYVAVFDAISTTQARLRIRDATTSQQLYDSGTVTVPAAP